MSSGEVRQFASTKKRGEFERIAQALRHGWKPSGKTSGKYKK